MNPTSHPTPSRDDTRTTSCPVCRRTFTPTGRQTYCGSPCRKAAYRRRQQPPAAIAVPTALRRREYTIYECPCAMRRSVISPAQRGEIGGISLDPMANPAPKGNTGTIACQKTSGHAQAYGVMR